MKRSVQILRFVPLAHRGRNAVLALGWMPRWSSKKERQTLRRAEKREDAFRRNIVPMSTYLELPDKWYTAILRWLRRLVGRKP